MDQVVGQARPDGPISRAARAIGGFDLGSMFDAASIMKTVNLGSVFENIDLRTLLDPEIVASLAKLNLGPVLENIDIAPRADPEIVASLAKLNLGPVFENIDLRTVLGHLNLDPLVTRPDAEPSAVEDQLALVGTALRATVALVGVLLALAVVLKYADLLAQQAGRASIDALAAFSALAEGHAQPSQESAEYAPVMDMLDIGVPSAITGVITRLLSRRHTGPADD